MTREWKTASPCSLGDCVQVSVGYGADSDVLVTDSKDPDGPTLRFGRDEWSAFLAGVRAGEFDVEEGA